LHLSFSEASPELVVENHPQAETHCVAITISLPHHNSNSIELKRDVDTGEEYNQSKLLAEIVSRVLNKPLKR